MVLPNSTYSASSDTFVPLTGIFERTPGTSNLYVPHWQLNVRTRLRFALVDTSVSPNRIVDYVNLDSAADPLGTSDRGPIQRPGQRRELRRLLYTPSGANGSMWCTNHHGGLACQLRDFGIMNQIAASMGHTSPDWNASKNEFPAGMSKSPGHRLLQWPVHPPGSTWLQIQHL